MLPRVSDRPVVETEAPSNMTRSVMQADRVLIFRPFRFWDRAINSEKTSRWLINEQYAHLLVVPAQFSGKASRLT